jgi:hypothetical protein
MMLSMLDRHNEAANGQKVTPLHKTKKKSKDKASSAVCVIA